MTIDLATAAYPSLAEAIAACGETLVAKSPRTKLNYLSAITSAT